MNTLKQMIILTSLTGVALCSKKVVDQSGNGDCTTISACISYADTIYIKAGEYIEQINLTKDNNNVVIIGENRDDVIINFPSSHDIKVDNYNNYRNYSLENLTFNGLYVEGSSSVYTARIKIKNCVVNTKIYLRTEGVIDAKNSIFKGISQDNNYGKGGHSIVNSLFIGISGEAIDLRKGSSIIRNNMFYNVSARAIYGNNSLTNASYNSYHNIGDADNISSTNNITADPKLLLSEAYSIDSDSPLIDAGDPNSDYNDPDGSRSDIGLYGGPYSWGKRPQITAISISPSTVKQGGSITITATAISN